MTMRRIGWRVITLSAVGALLAGCASTTVAATTKSPSATLPAGRYLGPVSAPTTVGQFEYDPPPTGYQPAVSWSAAYRACTDGSTICGDKGGPIVVLALVTSSATGETIDGREVFTFQHRPTYVFTWTDNDCDYVPAGPVSMPDASPAGHFGRMQCTTTTFIDANTGRGLYTVQTATP